MKLIAGLGNPGPRYASSRHNVGFAVVDELARRWMADVTRFDSHFQGLVGETQRGGDRVLLLKPATYMNLSGQSVAAVWRFYRLTLPDLLVVHDDLDLPVGHLRVRAGGSAGGHKGLADVIRHLSSTDVPRLRIGIGKVDRRATVEHVLGRFAPDERVATDEAVRVAADAVECWVARGIAATMNQFNRKRDGANPPADDAAPDPHEGEQS